MQPKQDTENSKFNANALSSFCRWLLPTHMHTSMHIINIDKELAVNFQILGFQEFITQSYYVNVVLLTCAVARRISVCP